MEKIKIVTLKFPEKTFKKLQNKKEESVILGKCKTWEEFVLLQCKVK